MKHFIAHPTTAAVLAAVWLFLAGMEVCHGEQEGRVYWTAERDLGWIQRADLDGSNLESVLTTDIETELMDPIVHLSVGSEKIYWVEWDKEDRSTIRRSDITGGNGETLVTIDRFVSAMASDPFGGKIYWAERYEEGGSWKSEIRRASVDGSNVESLVTEIESFVSGIALDMHGYSFEIWGELIPAENLYWAEFDTGLVRRADPDGSNVEILFTGIGRPMGLDLDWRHQDAHDDVEQRLYWVDWDTNTIRRARVDGSDVEVETVITGSGWRIRFSITGHDYVGMILWSDETLRLDYLDGTEYEEISKKPPHVFAADPFGYTWYTTSPGDPDSKRILNEHGDPLVLGMEGPAGLAVDRAEDRMYWLDRRTGSVRRARLDGTEVEDLVTELEEAKDLAVDVTARKLYWTEQKAGAIRRAGLDGSQVESLVTGLQQPESIALDVVERRVYWTSKDTSLLDSDRIQRSNMDGSGVETLATGLRNLRQVAVDPVEGQMYFGDAITIYRADLDGFGREKVFLRNGTTDIALDIGARKLYWTKRGSIRRSDLDGTNVEDVVTGLMRPVSLALEVPVPSMPAAGTSRTAVSATVKSDSAGSFTIEFVRTGRSWSTVTDRSGRFDLAISTRDPTGVSGMYEVRAYDEAGEPVGAWTGIVLEEGERKILDLGPGDVVNVLATEPIGERDLDPCSNGIAVRHPRINRGLVEDCRALQDFREVWEYWDDVDWTTSRFIGNWHGVEVRDSRVRELAFRLILPGDAFTGLRPSAYIRAPLSPELVRLTELEVISLPWQNLHGPVPPEFGQLTKLTRLDLNSSFLSGPIPPELGNLTRLTYLDLSSNRLTGSIPPELGNLTQLTYLDLSYNRLTGSIPPELGKLSQLTHLDLSINQFSGPLPSDLGQLLKLEELHLGNNQLTGPVPSELGQLHRLERVDLRGNQFTCMPRGLAQLGDWAEWAGELPFCGADNLDMSRADFDGNGTVGFEDFFLLAEAYGSSNERFDLDGSGKVDFGDFFLFADHFGGSARGKLLALAREMIGLPDGPQLQNAPNPFNGSTVLSWFVLTPGPVRLEVYNTLGQRVRTLVDEVQGPGRHQVIWDARDQFGQPVAAGVYLSRVQYPGGVQTQRLLYLE